MTYLSKVLHAKIKDSADRTVGRLKDIVITPVSGEYSPLRFLLVKSHQRGDFFVSYEYVENISGDEIELKSPLAAIPPAEPAGEYIFLVRDVLDQQIVDVGGARVVRVNDLRTGLFENKMCVLGTDISFKGILRRLGIAGLDMFDFFKVDLIDWRQTQPVKGTLRLNTVSKDLVRLHPADLADIIEDLNIKHGSRLVSSLDSAVAAAVMAEMEPSMQKAITNYLGPEKMADIISKMYAGKIS